FDLSVQEDGHWAWISAFGKSYDALADAYKCEVDRCISNGEAIDCQLIDADRKPRPVDMNPSAPSVHAQAKTCLQHHENRSRRPGLRQAGDWVGDQPFSSGPTEAAEELRQPHFESDGRFENPAHQ